MNDVNKKIAVLFCFHDVNKNSGATKSLLDIIDNLIEIGDVEMIAAFPKKEGSAIDYLRQRGIYIIPFCYGGWHFSNTESLIKNWYTKLKRIIKSLLTYTFLIRINKILKDKNIEVVYNNTITIASQLFLE